MTEQERNLLVKDLCARLPFGVYVFVHDTFEYSTVPYENVYLKSSDISSLIDSTSLNERYNSKDKRFNRIIKEHKDFLEFKPYLRPMSSMTEEEDKEFALWQVEAANSGFLFPSNAANVVNWLNQHHFDYNFLIEKGLALVAPKDMYEEK